MLSVGTHRTMHLQFGRSHHRWEIPTDWKIYPVSSWPSLLTLT
jgi:hypothetical protein